METNIQPNPIDTSPSVTPQASHLKKPTVFWLGLLAFAVLAAIVGFILIKNKPQIEETKVSSKPQISGLEIAKRTATFVDKTFLPDGSFYASFLCGSVNNSSPTECSPIKMPAEKPHVGQAIYGYFVLGEATGDSSYREKADKAMDFVLDRCEIDVRLCEWNFFPLSQYYFKTKDEKYLTRGMLRPAEGFLTMSDTDIVNGNVGHKLASLYQATNDERFKNRLLQVAEGELENADQDALYEIQVMWSIYAPAYTVSNDQRYLEAMEQYYDQHRITSEIGDYNNGPVLFASARAADGLLTLSKLSQKGDKYKAMAHEILQAVVYQVWDTPENVRFNGDYGFYDNFPNNRGADKSALNNGWLIKVFTMMNEDKFHLPEQAQ